MSSPQSQRQSPAELPVVVAGAGPIGMVTALELASHGVRVLLLERNPATTTYPKMDLTNVRSMELLRRLGLTDDARAAGVGGEHSFDVIFVSGLDGEEYARWSLPSADEMSAAISATNDGTRPREPWLRISQERMEAVLMAHCQDHPLVEVMRPWKLTEVTQHADGVTCTAVSVESGEVREIRCEYLAACEGAQSPSRQSLGIALEGTPDVAGTACQVHFKSRDRRTLHRFGQFWHLFMAREIGRVAIIAQDEVDTWTMQATAPPGLTKDDIDPVAYLRERTNSSLEIDEILRHNLWRPQALVAERYSEGRVFLVGDAAHQFIPTGGYGMNTGIGDAVDIGWKLAAVIAGWAGRRLLESYDAERRPVGVANRDWALRNSGVHRAAAELVPDERLLEADTPEGRSLRDRLGAHYKEHRGENESWGQELGYVYSESPVVAYDSSEPLPHDPFRYTPTTRPGARAPHVWLEGGESMHDRFGSGFTLVDFADVGASIEAAASAAGVPLTRVSLDDANAREVYERDVVLVRPDGHVAWRSNDAPDDPAALIEYVSGR